MLVAWAVRQASDDLLDPSCGDGQFLCLHKNSFGVDRDPDAVASARANAVTAKVEVGDFFDWASSSNRQFDCVVGNPPFIRYQTFNGTTRKRALALCRELGAEFTGLTSSWAPFITVAASRLRVGGRLAFIVPAEIGHAPYAAPLLEYLVRNFKDLHIVAIRTKIFPKLSEDCWLLFADGFGGTAKGIRLTAVDRFDDLDGRQPKCVFIDLLEWRTVWKNRLRPYLVSSFVRNLYSRAIENRSVVRFGSFATIGIGYVSGANDFFHVRPSDADRLRIPSKFLTPTVRSARMFEGRSVDQATVDAWIKSDAPMLLLRLKKDDEIPKSILEYLDSENGHMVRDGYKCRNRTPWYVVPDVRWPDYFLSYMSGHRPLIARNNAGCTASNAVHTVRLVDRRFEKIVESGWDSEITRLSCELEGHPLGGGMLKLEPREAANVVFPSEWTLLEDERDAVHCELARLKQWRHYEFDLERERGYSCSVSMD